jgi:hypothetical protein
MRPSDKQNYYLTIMKCLLWLFIVMFISDAFGNVSDSSRKELLILLKERQELFDEYTASLSKKSGIFGNKTKNDLRDSQEHLLEIVTADNKIMNLLNRSLDYRNFEKLNMTYDVSSYTDRINNLSTLNQSLLKRNTELEKDNKSYRTALKWRGLYLGFLTALLLLSVCYIVWKRLYRLK